MVRDTGVEPVSSVWKTDILADIRIPQTGVIITEKLGFVDDGDFKRQAN
jgi:hypothetical protein